MGTVLTWVAASLLRNLDMLPESRQSPGNCLMSSRCSTLQVSAVRACVRSPLAASWITSFSSASSGPELLLLLWLMSQIRHQRSSTETLSCSDGCCSWPPPVGWPVLLVLLKTTSPNYCLNATSRGAIWFFYPQYACVRPITNQNF